jgi:hypothetical protein
MEPDDYGLGNYGAPGSAAATPGAPPDPFTAADNVRLQRLSAGLSTVQQQVDEGQLSPEDGLQEHQQIHAMRAPLLARQQAWQQQQQQEAEGQMQQQAAKMAAMEHSEAIYRAQGVGDRIGTYTDPLSGETVHLVEDGQNKWREIEFPGQQAEGEGAATETTSSGSDTTVAQAPQETTAADSGGAVQPAADGGHVMTIQNGQNVEKWHFAPDGTTTRLSAEGPRFQQQQQGQAGPGMLNDAEVGELRRRAQQIVGPPPPRTGNPRIDQQLALHYQAQLGSMQSHLMIQHAKAKQAEANQGAVAGRQQSSQEFQKAQQEQKKADRDQQQHQHDLEGKYVEDRLKVEKHIMEQYTSGLIHGGGRAVKDKDGNATGTMPTNDEWEERVKQTLSALGMDQDLNAFRQRHGLQQSQTLQSAPAPVAGQTHSGDARQAGPPKPADHAKITGVADPKAAVQAVPHAPKPAYIHGVAPVDPEVRRRFGG